MQKHKWILSYVWECMYMNIFVNCNIFIFCRLLTFITIWYSPQNPFANGLWSIPDNKVHVAHMVPTWVLSAPGGPHVGPMNLAIRVSLLDSTVAITTSPSQTLSTSEIIIRLRHHLSWWWKHWARCWAFVRGIQRSPVISLHKGQWRGALMFSLICTRINGCVNNRKAGDLRRQTLYSNFKTVIL